MMKVLFLLVVLNITACTKGNNSNPEITNGMSVDQQETQKLIKNDFQQLQSGQYSIADDEIELLTQEGLLSSEELNSLNVVR